MKSRILCLIAGALGLLLPATGWSDIPNIIDPTGPVYATNVLGETIAFDVTVDNDDGTFVYTWKKNTNTIANPDGTDSHFEKAASTSGDAGAYTCYIANALGQHSESAPFNLTLWYPPAITTQPQGKVVAVGSNVTFSVKVNTTLVPTNFTYQWQFEEIDLPDATNANFTVTNAQPENEGNYTVNIFNAATALSVSGQPTTSTNAYLAVVTPPSITLNPEDQIVNVGELVQFTIVLDGSTTDTDQYPVTYQWRKNGVNISAASNPTATNVLFNLNAAQMADAGNYTVIAKNFGGSATSSPPAILMFLPSITNLVPASDFSLPAGSNVTFTVGATGTAPLSYQWLFNESPILGATSNKYTLHLGNAGQAGSYSVQVSNAACALAGVPPEENLGIYLTVLPETNRPSITITNPANGARWSNAVLTVRGTAADNGEVDFVRFKINTDTNIYTAAGTNVWVADFFGIPGTNTIMAYSVDYYGNQSTNATRNIFYVVPSPFTPLKSGLGTITTNWTGPNLEIGRNYTMSAAAATGFKFTGWTGGVTTTNASLTFMMQSNLVIQANFVDSQLPTIAITNPVSNATFSNSPAITVKGTASDNSQVAAVRWQLNSDAWAVASGTNSWQAGVTLAPGTNVFRAYSVDAGGNYSPTNSINLIYWLIAPVTVKTNGAGTVSPNYNGQTLILGKSYTMTATATSGSGYVFTNWTGGTNLPLAVLTNGAALKFVMESNLTVQANFADTNKPVLTITNPVSNATFSNSPIVTVKGTATDNSKTAEIRSQLNGGAWTVANGTNGWQTDVVLAPGTNVFRAYAVDPSGNYSPTNSINLIYWLIAPVTVQTNGRGTISPNYNNQTLILGKSYVMTAAGTNGFVFTNWTGGTNLSLPLLTNGTALTFVMQSNLTLRANFADTQKPTLTITNPASAAKFTNSTVQFRGLVGDNGPLTAIYWRLGTNSWNAAAFTNNASTNGWTLPVNAPVTGSNTFSAYAVDAAGNRSTTNSLSIVYSGSFALLTVQTNGQGTVTPNYNGQSLGLGQTFTMTAAGTNGYAFTNWLGGTNLPLTLLTNAPALTFTMRTNLTLQALFVDVENPAVTITNILPGGPLQNLSATLGGFATDNHQVVSVIFRVNSGAWTNAAGLSPWSASFPLAAGTNTFSIYSVDAAGNHSATNTLGTFVALLQPEIGSIIPSGGGGFSIQFSSVAGAVYSLEYKNSLTAPAWLPLGGTVAGNGAVISLGDTNPPAGERFYRLKVETP